MWLYVFMIAVFVIFVIILIWQTNIVIVDLESQNQKYYDYFYYYCFNNNECHNDDDDNDNDNDYYNNNVSSHLDAFEEYYIRTLANKFSQKSVKIYKPTRQFSHNYDYDDVDDNIFVGLEPWQRLSDFVTLLHTLIGYGVRFRDVDDSLYLDAKLAYALNKAILIIYDHLLTWNDWFGGDDDDSGGGIALFECLQNTCIVLRGFYDLTNVTESLLYNYLLMSFDNNKKLSVVARTCLPYVYGQLLRGHTFDDIVREDRVRYAMEKISNRLVKVGNKGIRYDYVNFDDFDVRAYDVLIDSYFVFDYYNFMFGSNTINLDNVHRSLMLIANNRGIVNPLLVVSNTDYSEALSRIMDYPDGVYAADFNKILTIRNDSYFGSIVGQTFDVAYHSNKTTGVMPCVSAMTRKIWPNHSQRQEHHYHHHHHHHTIKTSQSLGLESGVLLFVDDNNVNYDDDDYDDTLHFVSKTKSGNSNNLYPSLAFTAIATTTNAGVMIMHARFEELNLEFYSYTLYHRHGMFHLYDKIKSLKNYKNNGSSNGNAKCVVLVRDTRLEPKWMTVSANTFQSNGVFAKHHNIVNDKDLPNFQVQTFDKFNLQTVEQHIDADLVNAGAGVACFSLLTRNDGDDNTVVVRVPDTNIIIITTNTICCIIDFPVVVLRDDDTRQITINDATNISRTIHHLSLDKITKPLSLMSMSVDNLKFSQRIKRQQDRFVLHDVHGDEFKFNF
ncbi:ORF57 odv-e66 [Spodoptera exigua multiple nucleopolyhedrovirus]|uniref:ORF57 odv-e66 n=1 Tax=Spodoptera exigua nuclear polyhedrosis virus (strain US) TaxID=31506 RepID=Q9J878_NPVSE|nr:ORF57 odv-e66 [Spodoptera exigua multiple nucleopolyhedrovirus]AAF33587.1 ORF57 odv-e66 [Spodoptera exigua multiple nucleopolyhedrovirus]